MSDEPEVSIVIGNKKGLHARAAAKFVKTANLFDAKILVSKISGAGVVAGAPPVETSGGSILGLMMLGAERGSTIKLRASGSQAVEAINEIKKLVEERFGEE
jgi:phosphocarrier protein